MLSSRKSLSSRAWSCTCAVSRSSTSLSSSKLMGESDVLDRSELPSPLPSDIEFVVGIVAHVEGVFTVSFRKTTPPASFRRQKGARHRASQKVFYVARLNFDISKILQFIIAFVILQHRRNQLPENLLCMYIPAAKYGVHVG